MWSAIHYPILTIRIRFVKGEGFDKRRRAGLDQRRRGKERSAEEAFCTRSIVRPVESKGHPATGT